MPDTQQIIQSIEARLEEARSEIASLESAISALTASSASRPKSAEARPRQLKRAGRTPDSKKAGEPLTASGSSEAPAPKRQTGRGRPRELPPGAIEELLQAAAGGLSAAALIKQTGAAQSKVMARLRELEQAGNARGSGARRTSLWHWITDEQRIAERAAELEKRQGPADLTAA